jgi:predicted RNA binding protein YcfA (HicA-like mRNA interferase family)
MPRLRRVSGREAVRALERLGFEQVRQRGSHIVLKKQIPEGTFGCVVPMHRELAVGTLAGRCPGQDVRQRIRDHEKQGQGQRRGGGHSPLEDLLQDVLAVLQRRCGFRIGFTHNILLP